jgi:hypothetical protein
VTREGPVPPLRHPLSGTLDRVAPHLPPALVSATALARVRDAAAWLPAALSNWLYLECRLRRVQAGDASLPAALGGVEAWRRAAALARAWADPGSPLARAVESVWLEFDLDDASAAAGRPPAPGVFVDFTQEAFESGSPAERFALAEAALRPLLAGEMPDATARGVRRCFDALPAGAYLLYVGVLLPRGTDLVRLCVIGLGEDALLSYLRDVGWAGAPDELRALTSELARAPEIVHLDVGPSGAPSPRVGLEYPFARRSQLRGAIDEVALLDHLVTRGLCTPEKRDALARWPGHAFDTMRHELWPSLVVRRVNHVKLVCDAGRPVRAKGYLAMNHEFYRRR